MTTPRSVNYFINNVKLASPSLECQRRLIDLNLSNAPLNDKLQRLRHYNNEYSRVGACLPIIAPGINKVTSDFEAAIVAAGTTLNSIERLAVNNFYNTVQSFWSKLTEVYPFVGSALNGAYVPLKKTVTTNGQSPVLTNMFYDRNLGILIGENTRYIGFGATSEQLRASTAGLGHMKVVSISYSGAVNNNPLYGNAISATFSSDYFYPRFTDDNLYADMFSFNPATDRASATNTTNVSNNTYLITKTATGATRVFKEQGLFAVASTVPLARTLNANPFEIGRSRINATATIHNLPIRLKFFAVGVGLSDGEALTLLNAIMAFKDTLGR